MNKSLLSLLAIAVVAACTERPTSVQALGDQPSLAVAGGD